MLLAAMLSAGAGCKEGNFLARDGSAEASTPRGDGSTDRDAGGGGIDGGDEDPDGSTPPDGDGGGSGTDMFRPRPDAGPLAPPTAMLAPGEEVAVGPVLVTADQADISGPIMITAEAAPLPMPLPDGFVEAGENLEISVDDQDAVVAPLTIRRSYDPSLVPEGEPPVVLHYDDETGYTPATILAHDPVTATVTFQTRGFSHFPTAARPAPAPAPFRAPEFDVAMDTFSHVNVGGGPTNGNCFGMSAFSAWYWGARRRTPALPRLAGRFTPAVERVLAIRAQIEVQGVWNQVGVRHMPLDGDDVRLLKMDLSQFGPVVFGMRATFDYGGGPLTGGHAMLVYGYDDTAFFAYDPNLPGTEVRIPYDASGVSSTIPGVATEAIYAIEGTSSMVPPGAYDRLLADAEGGFTAGVGLTLTSPIEGEMLDSRTVQVTGTFASSLPAPSRAMVFVWGTFFDLNTTHPSFAGLVPALAGDTRMYVIVAPTDTQARFLARDSAVLEVNVSNAAPPAELMTMLTWDQNQSDMDLYVVAPDERAIWNGLPWSDLGNRPLDDSDGYGPEFITISSADTAGPPYVVQNGRYAIRVHLFRNDRGPGVRLNGRVFIAGGEGTPNLRTAVCSFSIAEARTDNVQPDDVGNDWVDVAWVDIEGAPAAPRIARIVSGARAGTSMPGGPRVIWLCQGADEVVSLF
ncbi:MAG: hypothetical protein IT379_20025 [Deltaproteobacteria bacterium]|nr:hypothetical protein [Deltaproteobacteria bacterium]